MSESVIVGMARTPFGRMNGVLASVSAMDLGSIAIKEALKRAGVSGDQVDYVIMGQVVQGGSGQNPARQASLKAGIPLEVPCITINKVCLSSLTAIIDADRMIRAGDADIVVTGGQENMSQGCYYVTKGRQGYRMGDGTLKDGMIMDALWCAVNDQHMGVGTDKVAEEFETKREDQDLWSARSHQRAAAAQEAGRLSEEIVPVEIQGRKGTTVVDKDEHIRPDTTVETLTGLKPAFRKENGTVTAGNASGINDGAASVILASREKAEELGLKPLATVLSYGMVAERAAYMATVPANAINQALKKIGKTVEDLDILEINEAFAAVCWHSTTMLGLDPKEAANINLNGGAISLGHPVGASGARITMALVNELKRSGGGLGAAGICGGGGQGDAIIVKVEG
ncbi:MAG: acetyl-CoA C-acetyltransferase [Actinobacteria bacterium]|nr:acetyl-CoA C-acetyltransferase [Actinomycetota bacterium]